MSKIGVIADVHGNLTALRVIWHELQFEHQVDETACAGDIVGVMGWPEETAHFIKENVDHVVYGNHDAYIRSDYSYVPEWPSQKQEHQLVTSKLTAETVEWLNSLPEQVEVADGVYMAHARSFEKQPEDSVGFPAHNYLDMGDWVEWASENLDGETVIHGHTHEQGKLSLDKFEGQSGYMLNPGSAGCPYYQDARYAVYDTDEREATLHRVYYDSNEVQARFDDLGLESAEELNKYATY